VDALRAVERGDRQFWASRSTTGAGSCYTTGQAKCTGNRAAVRSTFGCDGERAFRSAINWIRKGVCGFANHSWNG
jgi:hypothetical protein